MKALLAIVLCLLTLAPVAAQDKVLTLITHDSFSISPEVQSEFEAQSGYTLQIVPRQDAGFMVNEAILSKSNPLGDVMFGVDNTFLSRTLDNDLFIPYESPALKNIPDSFILDPEHRVTPTDYGDVCLNYDVNYVTEHNLPLPESLADLTKPIYKDLLVVENPATSSPGLAFLLATVGVFGTKGNYTYLDYWSDMVKNNVEVVDGWESAYYGEFSGSAGSTGSRPFVVSYASSPPAEVYFMEKPPESAPTGAIVADDTCFRQIEFVGILQGTKQLEAAQQLVDFMLSKDFQEDVPLQMFVFPVLPEAQLPQVFVDYAKIPEKPVQVESSEIDANRDPWIEAWTETVLR